MARQQWRHRSWWRNFTLHRNNPPILPDHGFFPEPLFHQKLVQERRRAERAKKPLLVMILNTGYVSDEDGRGQIYDALGKGVPGCLRDTDICGVLEDGALLGVILTEVEAEKVADAKRVVAGKIREKLKEMFNDEVARRVTISFRIYPEAGGKEGAFDLLFFPEIRCKSVRETGGMVVKRALDLLGSVTGLLLLAPAFVVLPFTIKLTSDGPVFFCQERIGLNGRKFKLFKFRTMVVGNRDDIHREFVTKLIEGKFGDEQDVFKITSDPRVTPVGRILRKYSLDELPQLFNVVMGDMSLVGPRPPIYYELEQYSGWQRNRLIGKKPGITGAWQVSGRSKTTFDEMVRLDLRYLKGWSVALDLKIILQTPLAVFRCRGAY